jgi:multicomponent Na+:H+ antiporter subunit E
MDRTQSNPNTLQKPRPEKKLLVLFVLLAAVWLLWSGLFKPLLIGLGLFSCLLTVWILHRMHVFSDATFTFRFGPRLVPFWAWLAKEIVVSSVEVARVTLAPKIRVSPRVVVLDVSDFTPADQVLLGNSITLTPGTLTLDVHRNRLLAHALTEAGAASLASGDMQRRVAALRGN